MKNKKLAILTLLAPFLMCYYTKITKPIDVKVNLTLKSTADNHYTYDFKIKNNSDYYIKSREVWLSDFQSNAYLKMKGEIFVSEAIAPGKEMNLTQTFDKLVGDGQTTAEFNYGFKKTTEITFSNYQISANPNIENDYTISSTMNKTSSGLSLANYEVMAEVSYDGIDYVFSLTNNNENGRFFTTHPIDLEKLTIKNVSAYQEVIYDPNYRDERGGSMYDIGGRLVVFMAYALLALHLIAAAIVIPICVTSARRRRKRREREKNDVA